MITKIPMPSGGTNTDRLRVVSWRKGVGEPVNRGDVLLEVETDKAVLEVESFAKGTLLKQAIPEGEFAVVGEVIAYIGNPEDAKDLDTPAGEEGGTRAPGGSEPEALTENAAAPDRAASVRSTTSTGAVQATPAAKRAIRELGVSIAAVHAATGKTTLTADDVTRFAAAREHDRLREGEPFDLQTLTPIRRSIADRMQIGASIPTFHAEIEIDASSCMGLRSDMNTQRNDVKVAYHDIIAKGVAVVCRSHPLVNASFTNEGIRVFRSVNVGLAVSIDQGLVVPVVRNVEEKTIIAIAAENARNIRQVRNGTIDAELLQHGTFTISNLGSYGIPRFTAILNPPQSCILAIGSIQTRAASKEGSWHDVPMMSITGTFDHRVVDGAYGARFLLDLKNILEHPERILDS